METGQIVNRIIYDCNMKYERNGQHKAWASKILKLCVNIGVDTTMKKKNKGLNDIWFKIMLCFIAKKVRGGYLYKWT